MAYFAEDHEAGDSPKVSPHLVPDGGVKEEAADDAAHDVGNENRVGGLGVLERDFGDDAEPNVESSVNGETGGYRAFPLWCR